MACGRFGPAWCAAGIILVAGVAAASAAELPAVRTGQDNAVPACATPDRVMAFVRGRNPALDARFASIGAEYQRQGTVLGVRWDMAVFHMLHETSDLSFTRGRSAVTSAQYNLASLGAVGPTDTGESFPDLATGVRAHLEHLLVYAGAKVHAPAAERTRKVQAWGVLKPWQQQVTGPIGFTEVFYHWGNKTKHTVDAVARIATAFEASCRSAASPMAKAAPPTAAPKVAAVTPPLAVTAPSTPTRPEAVDPSAVLPDVAATSTPTAAPPESMRTRFGLGAGGVLSKSLPQVRVLNEPPPASPEPPVAPVTPPMEPIAAAGSTAGLGTRAIPKAVEAPAARTPGQKCRVWTASYGGTRSVIVRSVTDGVVNFTVLDVNAGQEKREAAAYIGAFAKGGTVAYEFPTQATALEKAFDLCPEG